MGLPRREMQGLDYPGGCANAKEKVAEMSVISLLPCGNLPCSPEGSHWFSVGTWPRQSWGLKQPFPHCFQLRYVSRHGPHPCRALGGSPSPKAGSSHPSPRSESSGRQCSCENGHPDQTRPDQCHSPGLASRQDFPALWFPLWWPPTGEQIAPEEELQGVTRGPKAVMREEAGVETTLF